MFPGLEVASSEERILIWADLPDDIDQLSFKFGVGDERPWEESKAACVCNLLNSSLDKPVKIAKPCDGNISATRFSAPDFVFVDINTMADIFSQRFSVVDPTNSVSLTKARVLSILRSLMSEFLHSDIRGLSFLLLYLVMSGRSLSLLLDDVDFAEIYWEEEYEAYLKMESQIISPEMFVKMRERCQLLYTLITNYYQSL